MKTETKATLLWIICIAIVLLLSLKLYIDADNYTCDECRIKLSNKQVGSKLYDFGNPRADILVEAYKEGECLIVWDPIQGFMNNGYSE